MDRGPLKEFIHDVCTLCVFPFRPQCKSLEATAPEAEAVFCCQLDQVINDVNQIRS